MTAPFISLLDLQQVTGRTVGAGPGTIALDAACEIVRGICRQRLNYATDTVELQGNQTTDLWLPERPVIDVTAIELRWRGFVREIPATWFTFTRRGRVMAKWTSDVQLLNWPNWDGTNWPGWAGEDGTVIATYSHGYAATEDEVDVVAGIERMPSDIRRFAIHVANQSMEKVSEEARDDIGYVGDRSESLAQDSAFDWVKEEERLKRRYRLPGETTSIGVGTP